MGWLIVALIMSFVLVMIIFYLIAKNGGEIERLKKQIKYLYDNDDDVD